LVSCWGWQPNASDAKKYQHLVIWKKNLIDYVMYIQKWESNCALVFLKKKTKNKLCMKKGEGNCVIIWTRGDMRIPILRLCLATLMWSYPLNPHELRCIGMEINWFCFSIHSNTHGLEITSVSIQALTRDERGARIRT
jgi:hypothetical protein